MFRTLRFLIAVAMAFVGMRATAQVDTLRLDTSGEMPVLYLRDHSLAPGVSSASASESLAVVRYGPVPDSAPSALPPRTPRAFPLMGVLWIGAIALAILLTAIGSLESWRRKQRRLDVWDQRNRR